MRGQTDHDHDGVANLLLDLRFRGSFDIHSAFTSKNLLESCTSLVERAAIARAKRELDRASYKTSRTTIQFSATARFKARASTVRRD